MGVFAGVRMPSLDGATAGLREHDAVRERTLEMMFLEPGAEAYAFTFG